jgi:hypothetical protein
VQDDFTPEQLTVGRNVSDYLKRIGVYGQWTPRFLRQNSSASCADS